MQHVLLLFEASAVMCWTLLLLPPLALAAASGSGRGLVIPALYVSGIGDALVVYLAPGFEHGATTASTPAHDHVSQAIYFATFWLAGLAMLGAIQNQSRPATRRWVFGLISYGLTVNLSAIANGDWNFRLLQVPAVLFVVTRGRGLPIDVLLRHLRYILRIYTLGSVLMLLTSRTTAVLDVQGRTLFGLPQLTGLTSHPNVLGPIAALAFAVELAHLAGSSRLPCRSFVGVAGAVIACALAQSRAGWLAAAAVGVVFTFRRLNNFGRVVVVAALGAISVILVASAPDVSVELNGRAGIWQQAFAVFRDHPILGGGPDALAEQVRIGLVAVAGAQAHNEFLEAMAISGSIGIAFILVFVLYAARRSFLRGTGSVVTAAFCVLLIDMCFESPIGAGHVLILGVAALLASDRTCVNGLNLLDEATPKASARMQSVSDTSKPDAEQSRLKCSRFFGHRFRLPVG
jgi:O-Antigen ligase